MAIDPIDDAILADLFGNHRTFLPGKRCSRRLVAKHFNRAILLDGLDREESHLILSTLPAGADRIYLSPLDKGLSGSKVYSAKFDIEGRRVSKLFVLKVGSKDKLDAEYLAVEQLVSPHISGVGQPVYRIGRNKALLAQELAGLSSNATLVSLKNYIRSTTDPVRIIHRLLCDRLGHWYQQSRNKTHDRHKIASLFRWHLSKVTRPIYPQDWVDLQTWVTKITGQGWGDIDSAIASVKSKSITTPTTIVHGDLHSQNVLVDERDECWPIDFAWCHDNTSPVLDFTMLECSLKFLAIPQRSDLRVLIGIEDRLAREPYPTIAIGEVPYSKEISSILKAIISVRRLAIEDMGISFDDYMASLCIMTYVHSTHPMLNLPFVLASLQLLIAREV